MNLFLFWSKNNLRIYYLRNFPSKGLENIIEEGMENLRAIGWEGMLRFPMFTWPFDFWFQRNSGILHIIYRKWRSSIFQHGLQECSWVCSHGWNPLVDDCYRGRVTLLCGYGIWKFVHFPLGWSYTEVHIVALVGLCKGLLVNWEEGMNLLGTVIYGFGKCLMGLWKLDIIKIYYIDVCNFP